MIAYFLLLIVAVSAENCSYTFESQLFSRSSILTIRGLPTNLVFNPINKDLLFTLIDVESLHNDDMQTKMDQYILREGEPVIINNVNGQASAVDVKNQRVYIASDDGLNVLNKTNKANFVSFKDEDIVQLFKPQHNDNLYAVLFPDNDVYLIDVRKNEKKKLVDIPCAFILAVDNEENIFYECDSKYVKVLLNGFHEAIEFVGIGKNSARAITVDDKGRVILASNDGLYHLRPDNLIPKKVMDLDFIPSGIAFDGDDIFISTNGIIYRYSGDYCD